MNKKQISAAVMAVAVGVCSFNFKGVEVNTFADDEVVKIMSIGDSITDGYWEQGAYRKYMYSDLAKRGYNIDMVGPKGGGTTTFDYNGETVSYDTNYAGYSGFAIQKMPDGNDYTSGENRSGILETIQSDYDYSKDGVQNMVEAYSPDVVLLQIGTNDILSNYNTNITGRLENLVNVILSGVAEDGVVYVASIPDIDVSIRYDWLGGYGINVWQDGGIAELTTVVQDSIDNYNASIKEMVENMQNQGKSVRFGDINSVVDYKTDLYDGVHPNEAGYENMGLYWSELLAVDYFNGEEKPFVTTTVTGEIPVETTTELTTITEPIATTEVTTTENKILVGDFNNDGMLNVFDLSLMKYFIFTKNEEYKAMGDFNNDGSFTLTDVVSFSRFILGYNIIK